MNASGSFDKFHRNLRNFHLHRAALRQVRYDNYDMRRAETILINLDRTRCAVNSPIKLVETDVQDWQNF